MDYDADRAPDPTTWLAADEPSRLAAVEAFHRSRSGGGAPSPALRVHYALHVVVEEQLAAGDPPQARAALDRLVRAGRSRHEALHLLADVAAEFARRSIASGRFEAEGYARALEALGGGRE